MSRWRHHSQIDKNKIATVLLLLDTELGETSQNSPKVGDSTQLEAGTEERVPNWARPRKSVQMVGTRLGGAS
jgi:hypothetical protein